MADLSHIQHTINLLNSVKGGSTKSSIVVRERSYDRFSCEIPVRIVTQEGAIEGTARNISLGGVFIDAEWPAAFGTEAKIELLLPGMQDSSALDATARWVNADGVGMQFGNLRARDVWALNRVMRKKASA